MTKRRLAPVKSPPPRWYRGADVPMRVIRRFASQVAERFRPEKIILFGSHAYGAPRADSDVDILVIMPCRNQLDQAFKIRLAVPAPFPMDLIVRTPHSIQWRLAEGDLFHTQIVTKGRVLYEKDDARMGIGKAEDDYRLAAKLALSNQRFHDQLCFHCQQSSEKYLKALLEELGIPVEKTHELDRLLTHLLPHHASLRSMRRGLVFLSDFAVAIRYPGERASKRQAHSALRWAGKVRDTCRKLLGLPLRRRQSP